ncbi:MAG: phage adaptor protein [Luminiphilus sp.]
MPTTYQELKDEVLNFANHMALEQSIDTFINLTEADLSRRLRHWRMERRSTAALDTQYTALPNDFNAPIRFSLTGDNFYKIDMVSHTEIMSRREANNNTAGRPKVIAMTADSFEVQPTPDQEYTLEMVYYSTVPALSSSNTSNWVLEYYPDAYLYGTLSHTAPYLNEDVRMQTWLSLYNEAISAINSESERAEFGRSNMKMNIRSF